MPCPDCSVRSSRVHSTYERRLADTPVGGQPVLVELTVRRLYCENTDCQRRTFVEQVQGLTVRYGRGTPGSRRILEAVAVALAGRAGSRFAGVLGMRRLKGVPATNRTGAMTIAPTVTASRTAWIPTTLSIRIAPVCRSEETRPPLSRNVCLIPVATSLVDGFGRCPVPRMGDVDEFGVLAQILGAIAERYPVVRLRGDVSCEPAYALLSHDRN
ncbi:transposase family protein [Streptomyces lavendulae]|uniref:transposase family protein n=1 Tax=Streptomyces lavendulae TaxID=1914 RepID=UPI003818466C